MYSLFRKFCMNQVEVFWAVTSSSVVGYQRFRGPYCLHLQVEVFWVVTPCNDVVDTNVSEVHTASIFRVKMCVNYFLLCVSRRVTRTTMRTFEKA